MSNRPDTDVVKITTINPDTGEELDRPFFGVAVGDNMSYRITRSAETLDELRAQIGDLHDPRAIWEHALEHDELPLGEWDDEWNDEDDEDYLCFSPQAAR